MAIACPIDIGVRPPVASINKSFGGVITGLVKSPRIGFAGGNDCVVVSVVSSDDVEVILTTVGTIGEPNF